MTASWKASILRTADDVTSTQGDITTSAGTIMVDTCGDTGVTSIDVVKALSESDTNLGVRVREGLPIQTYVGSTWTNADPTLDLGEMLVRSIACTEHEDRPGLFRVNYESSGIGPFLETLGNPGTQTILGTPHIQISTVSRPRMAAAYRAGCTPKTDQTITSGTPDVWDVDTDWHDGQDIGGVKIDVNTAPLTIPIDQTVISFSYPVRYPYREWGETWTGCRNLTTMNDGIGGRNAETFLRFPAGSLMLESIDIQPLHHEFRMVTMTLVHDQWHHAQQVPKVVAQFAAPTETNTTTLQSHAAYVLWQQPHRDLWYVNSTTGQVSLEDLIDSDAYFAYFARFDASCS